MKGYHPLDNGTLFSDMELWLLRTFDPESVPARYRYLKPRIYGKMFANSNSAINTILNFAFSVKYEPVDKDELEEIKCQLEGLLKRLEV